MQHHAYSEKERAMKKITICVFGVNGVGKSVLLEAVQDIHPDAIVVRGSTLLKEALSVASYEALESMSSCVKKKAIIDSIIALTEDTKSPITIVDTHLVVPIRKSHELTVEDMWDDGLLGCFQGFIYIQAHPSMVSERRQINGDRVLRALNSSSEVCSEDLRLNACRWDEICPKMQNKKVIVNDQSVFIGAMKISHFIRELQVSF